MSHLPPHPDFSLTPREEQKIIEELCALDIAVGTISKTAKGWNYPSLVKPSRATHTFYPHFQHILALYASDPKQYADAQSGLRFDDILKYRLIKDLYKAGLYDPTPGSDRLHGLIEFLYFPDCVKDRCDKADKSAGNSSGKSFSRLIKLWQLMALSVNDMLYRSSTTAYVFYARYWGDVDLRFVVGIKLIKIAIFYADYDLAEKLIEFLREQRSMLDSSSDFDHYTDTLELLEHNSKAHLQEDDTYPAKMRGYRRLYQNACKRNDDVLKLPIDEQRRHLKLLKRICVGACRLSVRHVTRVLSDPQLSVEPHSLDIAAFFASQLSDHVNSGNLKNSNHDWDTLSRTCSVVLCEHAKAMGQGGMIPQHLNDAREYQTKSEVAKDEVRERDKIFVADVCNSSELARWVVNVSPSKINLGTLFNFWEGISLALLELQIGRLLSQGEARKSQFDKVLTKIQELEGMEHSFKVKHSRHMLASIRTIVVAESPK